MTILPRTDIIRRRFAVHGIVQGVGFRPFVYAQALRCGLAGYVLNDSAGVTIEVEGDHDALSAFERALHEQAPPLARVDRVLAEAVAPRHDSAFVIRHSEAGAQRRTLIATDTATCDDCLRELWDPADRRFRYPFINCTNCGPRFTIVEDVPYDREKTTMRGFPMCAACRAEYEDPLNRRFHAQPNACPDCGPHAWLLDGDGRPIPAADPLDAAARLLAQGSILAIKGLGGYHLACDALNRDAVATLRRRKHREAKPFALMAPDLATVEQICIVDVDEAALLHSRRRPIVLLPRRGDQDVAEGIAPGYATLGVMLPYTPLHHLLLRSFASHVADRPPVLVMTSGNRSDEPIAYGDADARQRLASIADAWLVHNRPIHIRCDDSVTRVAVGGEQLMRRARGYAPEPLALPVAAPEPILACGGHLKNTFCLAKDGQAFVGQHIGDLENLETLQSFTSGIAHFEQLFDIRPTAVAYDLHPEYLATKHALDLDVPTRIGVQHHHAHIASVLAEHGRRDPVIGVSLDGTGFGLDGTIWGGEVLVADLCRFERAAHLRYVPLPGGDQAVRQVWRMAAVYLWDAFGDAMLELPIPFVQALDRRRWRAIRSMIARGVNSPPTSSCGRLFDAVAALLGLRDEVLYEGQAAIELEMLAEPRADSYPFAVGGDTPLELDLRPTIRAIVADLAAGEFVPRIAGRFHQTLATALAAVCTRVHSTTGLRSVALSGGVIQNRLLLDALVRQLEDHGFEVLLNRRVPPNDGGLSFGQAAVAAARLHR